MTGRRQMRLGAFLRPCGHHVAAWRHPEAPADAAVNFAHNVELAKTAERGLFDLVFHADTVSAQVGADHVLHLMSYTNRIDPFSILTATAAVTEQIGLICTSTTSYDQPYMIARRFAGLDLISGGRAGWNLITSANANEAVNFDRDEPLAKHLRYARAREFAEVVLGLWDSWDDDAFIRDKESGTFFKPEGMHVLNHVGEHFKVRGPLNVGRSQQGRPVMVQAGASDEGIDLAAATADVVFCVQQSIEQQKGYHDRLKGEAAAYGRSPDDIKVMPGLMVVVAPTRAEAEDKQAELDALIVPEAGQALLSAFLGYDIYDEPLDGPLPPPPDDGRSYATRTEVLNDMARRENLTIRKLYERIAAGRGHNTVIGSYTDVADHMQETFEAGAADGFNIMPSLLPGGLDAFVELVVPELQRRGLFRTAYEGPTLRDKLGLKWPESRYRQARKVPAPEPAE